jgi:hypothetical protein
MVLPAIIIPPSCTLIVPKPDVTLVVRLRRVEKIDPLGLVQDGLRVASLGLLLQLFKAMSFGFGTCSCAQLTDAASP